MSAELIAILAVGVALATFIRVSLKDLRGDLTTRIDRLETRMDRLEARLTAVEHGQAKLEGLLEGLREAIAGRRVPTDAA